MPALGRLGRHAGSRPAICTSSSGTRAARSAGFLRDLRLEACREALADPAETRTLAETAYRAGFSDQAQFSRLFKARYGATPKEYRMRARAR